VLGHFVLPGDILVVRLTGLSGAGNQTTLIWVVVALAIVVSSIGAIYIMRKKRLQPVQAEDDSQEKQRLLVEISRLDLDWSACG
jgi:cell division protein FtsL